MFTFFAEFWINFDYNASECFEKLDLKQVLVFEDRIAQKRLQLSIHTFKYFSVGAVLDNASERWNWRASDQSYINNQQINSSLIWIE